MIKSHRQRRNLENSILRKQILIVKVKQEIASAQSDISKDTRHEIEMELA